MMENELKIGFIGAAASTIVTASYFVRDLKNDQAFKKTKIDAYIFDPEGFNTGPAYRFRSAASVLNQPAGQEMNPFHNGGPDLPPSFLEWLQNRYGSASFPPRRDFGTYLLDLADRLPKAGDSGNITVHEIKDAAVKIEETSTGARQHSFLLKTGRHGTVALDGFVLATGHTFSPRLDHSHYLAAYVGKDYEQRLAATANDTNEKIVIGSGASMVDNVSALEYFGNQGSYRIVSPYGNTCWPYDPEAPKPPDGKAQSYAETFVDSPYSHRNPADSMRRVLKAAAHDGVAPQYVLSAVLAHPDVQQNEDVLKTVKAFYGNPLSPERFALLSRLEQEGRLNYDIDRVNDIQPEGNNLRIDFGNSSEISKGHVIDCAVVHRGIRNAQGEISNPLIAQLVDDHIISVSNKSPDAIDPLTDPKKLIFAVGPVTNAFKNGIETFAPVYRAVAAELTTRLKDHVAKPQAVVHAKAHSQVAAFAL